jgi:hypothetical protein
MQFINGDNEFYFILWHIDLYFSFLIDLTLKRMSQVAAWFLCYAMADRWRSDMHQCDLCLRNYFERCWS